MMMMMMGAAAVEKRLDLIQSNQAPCYISSCPNTHSHQHDFGAEAAIDLQLIHQGPTFGLGVRTCSTLTSDCAAAAGQTKFMSRCYEII